LGTNEPSILLTCTVGGKWVGIVVSIMSYECCWPEKSGIIG